MPTTARRQANRAIRESQAVGRPSRYRKDFANQIIAFCKKGYSLTAFAGEIGISRSDITEWSDRYDEFAKACDRAKAAATLYWERLAHRQALRGTSGGQVAMTLFMLKNFGKEDFTETVRHEGPNGGPLALELLLGKLNQPNVIDALPVEGLIADAPATTSGSAQLVDADDSAT